MLGLPEVAKCGLGIARGMFATWGLTVVGLIDREVEFRVKLDLNLPGVT